MFSPYCKLAGCVILLTLPSQAKSYSNQNVQKGLLFSSTVSTNLLSNLCLGCCVFYSSGNVLSSIAFQNGQIDIKTSGIIVFCTGKGQNSEFSTL